jgi:hypothetical protein
MFAKGDDSALFDLEMGSFTVDAGTVYRFYNKVRECYEQRKKRWVDQYSRLVQVHRVRTENELMVVFQQAKANLQPIARFVSLKALPDDLKETLAEDFKQFVDDMRKNIKEAIRKNDPHNERLLLVIENLNFFDPGFDSSSGKVAQSTQPCSGTGPKRRILF